MGTLLAEDIHFDFPLLALEQGLPVQLRSSIFFFSNQPHSFFGVNIDNTNENRLEKTGV